MLALLHRLRWRKERFVAHGAGFLFPDLSRKDRSESASRVLVNQSQGSCSRIMY